MTISPANSARQNRSTSASVVDEPAVAGADDGQVQHVRAAVVRGSRPRGRRRRGVGSVEAGRGEPGRREHELVEERGERHEADALGEEREQHVAAVVVRERRARRASPVGWPSSTGSHASVVSSVCSGTVSTWSSTSTSSSSKKSPMPDRCASSCSTVTPSSTSGRSSPRTERAVVSRSSEAALDEAHDGERGEALRAARDREAGVDGVRRPRGPGRRARTRRRRAAASPSVTPTTPEKPVSAATASIAAARSSVIARTLVASSRPDRIREPIGSRRRPSVRFGRVEAADAYRGGPMAVRTRDRVDPDGRWRPRVVALAVTAPAAPGRRVRRAGGRERDDPARPHHDAGRVPRRRRALRHVVRVHRRGQGGRVDRAAARRCRPRSSAAATGRCSDSRGRSRRPSPEFAAADAAAAGGGAEVILETKIDALDITVIKGGGDAVGKWALDHGFFLSPDAPEVLDFYARAQPDLHGGALRRVARRGARSAQRRRHADHGHDADGPPVGAVAHPRARREARPGDRGRRVPAHRLASRSCSPVVAASPSTAARRRRASLLDDLRSDKGMDWVPTSMWFTHLPLRRRGRRPRLRPRGLGRAALAARGSTDAGIDAPDAVVPRSGGRRPAGLAVAGGARGRRRWRSLAVAGGRPVATRGSGIERVSRAPRAGAARVAVGAAVVARRLRASPRRGPGVGRARRSGPGW